MQENENNNDNEIVDAAFGAGPAPMPPLEGVPLDDDVGETLPPDPDDDVPEETLAALVLEPANDTGNGKRLLAHFGDVLMHVREMGWFEWRETHWEREGGDEFAIKCAQRTAARIALEADHIAASASEAVVLDTGREAKQALDDMSKTKKEEWSEADKKRARSLESKIAHADIVQEAIAKRQITRRKYAVSSGNSSKIAGMLNQALPHRTVSPEDLDSDPLKFNCENGTLVFSSVADPDAGELGKGMKGLVDLTEHTRGDLMTKLAPVAYDPTAKAPKFRAFVEKFQPNENLRRFLQTYLGYSITGLAGEQIMVFSYGLGANGKSTLIDIVAKIMGGYSQTLSFETLADDGFGRRGDQATPDLVRLPGARLVRASEPKRGVHLNEAMIKSLTGGEPMLVRDLHKKFFEFRPDFKLILSGNHKPEISGGDHGIWRRVCLLPWDVTIPKDEQRPFAEISAEFWAERSGILNWLIEGALNYLTNGLHIPDEVKAATETYREEMDPIANFLRDCVLKNAMTTNDEVQAREMYRAFEEWCDVNVVRAWKENAFGRAMSQKGVERKRSNGKSLYLAVRLNPERPRSDRRSSERAPDAPFNDEVPLS